MLKFIKLRGVKTNNLKRINIDIPRNKLTVITGLSGSGKTSLAFDTIYAQAKKEYLESFSVYNRGSLGKIKSPDFTTISGLSPVIAIEQSKLGNNPRSTVGTYTDMYTYLRLLFSRFSKPSEPTLPASHFSFNNPEGACERCRGLGYVFEIDVDKLIDFNKSLNEGAIQVSQYKPGSYVLEKLESTDRFDFDKPLKNFNKEKLDQLLHAPAEKFKRTRDDGLNSWTCEGIITRMKRLRKRRDKKSLKEGKGTSNYRKDYYSQEKCPVCEGQRLQQIVLDKKIASLNINEVSRLSILQLVSWLDSLKIHYAGQLIDSLKNDCKKFIDLGLEYLSLDRPIPTLSGGESQRTKLVRHLGLNLIELIYILDEPTIGMHHKNINKIVTILKKLRDKGNTVIVVEHDEEIMKNADYLIDIGPKAGRKGGRIVAKGSFSELIKKDTLTSRVLKGEYKFKNKPKNRKTKDFIQIQNARKNNLRNISVKFALETLNLVIGVSGAGKSSLIEEFLQRQPKAVFIDQSPIGRSVRSNPATYTDVFDDIRKEFADKTGCSSSLLSFNSKGKCKKCKGIGTTKIGMHFLEDVEVVCEECGGKRYNREALSYKYKDKTIADVLAMNVDEAYDFFETQSVREKLGLLKRVGLGYIKLGQSAKHLSGGEAQRIKLAKMLNKSSNILILDEPTVGLHPVDIDKLLTVLHSIVDKGNTVIVVEHNMQVIRNADWVVKLGPRGGRAGGKLMYEGTVGDFDEFNV
jgi:excinuclease UvrABC ATPase subunit